MKKYLRIIPISVLFMIVLIPLASMNAWRIWGTVLPSGDCEIQVYWKSRSDLDKRDYRITQDIDLLELDEFIVWFRFEKVDKINFTVQLYDYSVQTRTKIDPETNETYTTQIKIYDILKKSKDFSVSRGDNINDKRFAEIYIDRENFPALKSTNVTQLIQVICQGFIIEFYHKTDPSLVEVIKRAGEWNTELIGTAFVSMAIIMCFVMFAVQIKRKVGRAPSPPHWFYFVLLAGALVLIYVAFMGLQGEPTEMIERSFTMIPWFVIPTAFGCYLVFYLLDRFSADLRTYFFLTIKLKENRLRIGPYILYGYRRKGKLEMTIDPESWFETVKKLFVGGFKPPDEVVNPTVRVDSDNPVEFQDIFPVAVCNIQPTAIKKHKPGWKTCGFAIGAFMFMFLPLMVGTVSFLTAILTSSLFIVSLIVIVIDSTSITNPSIKIDPLDHRSQVAVITDARAVDSIAGTLRETLKNWAKDRSKVSADSVKYVKYALKEYEDAYKGIGKDIEIELDEETVKDIKEVLKTLKWNKSKKIVDELEAKLKKKDTETPMPMPD